MSLWFTKKILTNCWAHMWRDVASPVPPGYLGPHQLCGVQLWLCSWHVLCPRWSGWHFKVADTLHLVAVPKRPTHGSEHDEKFLRKMYQVLLKVDVLEGNLQCPESAHMFPSAWDSQHAADWWGRRNLTMSGISFHSVTVCIFVHVCPVCWLYTQPLTLWHTKHSECPWAWYCFFPH